ncbi:MAG: FtsX-like permease family protein [Planctomycetota bacterium]|nr:FtsX-like permease family protein [Planctomycetota bacterium]
MIALALRIIAHSPMRYLVALLGISVAAGLAFIQLGLYHGFKENASVVVDHTRGDIWVCAEYTKNFDFPNLIGRQQLDKVRATPGVAWAEPMLIIFGHWKFLDGERKGEESTVQIVGFDTETERKVGSPWNMVAGFPEELAQSGCVSIDATMRQRLDNADVDTVAEVNGIRVKVVGLSDGIRSFQGNPMVFTNMDTARSIGHLRPDDIHYVIVGVENGAVMEDVLGRLRALGESDHVEAYTQREFSFKAQDYWLRSTGAGTALALAALMGLVVGIVVAAQVLYTSTIEHLKEYGTLKAIGASNVQVAMAIVAQAIAWAIPAHLIAGGLLLIAMHKIEGKGIHLSLEPETYAWLGLGTVVICVLASILSVWRVMRVEPADVFKG